MYALKWLILNLLIPSLAGYKAGQFFAAGYTKIAILIIGVSLLVAFTGNFMLASEKHSDG